MQCWYDTNILTLNMSYSCPVDRHSETMGHPNLPTTLNTCSEIDVTQLHSEDKELTKLGITLSLVKNSVP